MILWCCSFGAQFHPFCSKASIEYSATRRRSVQLMKSILTNECSVSFSSSIQRANSTFLLRHKQHNYLSRRQHCKQYSNLLWLTHSIALFLLLSLTAWLPSIPDSLLTALVRRLPFESKQTFKNDLALKKSWLDPLLSTLTSSALTTNRFQNYTSLRVD